MADTVKKVVDHGRVFADFWLGMVGAGVRGLAEAVGKPRVNNESDKSMSELVQDAVDRTAKGLRVALEGAMSAAASTEKELEGLRTQERRSDQAAQNAVRHLATLLVEVTRTTLPSSIPPPPTAETRDGKGPH